MAGYWYDAASNAVFNMVDVWATGAHEIEWIATVLPQFLLVRIYFCYVLLNMV